MADDFFTKQLPHNVTWGLTVLYALDASKDLNDLAAQVGATAHSQKHSCSMTFESLHIALHRGVNPANAVASPKTS